MIRTKGSLCTGTGGLDAFLPGGLSWLAETDDSCTRLLKREHPDVPNLGDITAPDFAGGYVDLLTSGDPCQSMSVAGRQMASDDARFLWPHVIQVIDRVRPKHIFLENVQNVTSVALVKGADDWRGEKGSVLAMRLADLRAAGYACRWTVLGACSVGACHHRHRWFLRGEYVGQGAQGAERLVMKCGAPRTGGRVLLPSPTTADGSGGPGTSPKREGGMNLRTAVQLLPSPTVADARNTRNATAGRSEGVKFNSGVTLSDVGFAFEKIAHPLLPTPRATDGVNGGPNQRGRKGDLAMGSAVQVKHWGKFAPAVQLWAETSGMLPPGPTEPAPRGGRRLNAALSEWMMGHRPGFLTDEFSRNDALRMAGNGAMAVQARAAWDLLAPIKA